MPVDMTANIHCHRKPRNMRGICINIHAQRSHRTSQPAWTYTKLVNLIQHLLFHFFYIWNV